MKTSHGITFLMIAAVAATLTDCKKKAIEEQISPYQSVNKRIHGTWALQSRTETVVTDRDETTTNTVNSEKTTKTEDETVTKSHNGSNLTVTTTWTNKDAFIYFTLSTSPLSWKTVDSSVTETGYSKVSNDESISTSLYNDNTYYALETTYQNKSDSTNIATTTTVNGVSTASAPQITANTDLFPNMTQTSDEGSWSWSNQTPENPYLTISTFGLNPPINGKITSLKENEMTIEDKIVDTDNSTTYQENQTIFTYSNPSNPAETKSGTITTVITKTVTTTIKEVWKKNNSNPVE